MPAGDAHRTWFPEMVEELRRRWKPDSPFRELIELSDNLDLQVTQIRTERHIRPPMIRCSKCGHSGRAAEPRVSVRAVILAASRFGIESQTVTRAVERRWAKYRTENELDLYGKSDGSQEDKSSVEKEGCEH